MSRTPAELETLLAEQVLFLHNSAEAFDRGELAESKRLATSCRVLFRGDADHPSLLAQMGLLDDLQLADNADEVRPEHVAVMGPLAMTMGETTTTRPRLEDSGRTKPFPAWWTDPVLRWTVAGDACRRDLLLWHANQDGGTHVDVKLRRAHRDLKRPLWTGAFTDSGSVIPYLVRGFAHEVLLTLSRVQWSAV